MVSILLLYFCYEWTTPFEVSHKSGSLMRIRTEQRLATLAKLPQCDPAAVVFISIG